MQLINLSSYFYETHYNDVISHAIKYTFLYEDAEVLLYPALVKTIRTRKWTAKDLRKRPEYINAAAGIYPYNMVDLSDDDIAFMQQEHENIPNASLV